MTPDWPSFVNSEGPRLFKYFLARFDAQTADDLVQEVLIRVVRKVRSGEFDASRGNLTAFSFGIAHNMARDQFKQCKRSLEDTQRNEGYAEKTSSEMPHIDDVLIQKQELQRLKSAIAELSVPEQEVISLLVSRDLSLPEVASAVNLPLNTVKSHIHRAKAKLQNYMTPSTLIGKKKT